MTPVICFAVGVLIAEIYQWGAWKAKNLTAPWLDYWKVGLPQLLTNLGGDVVIAAAWSVGWLDIGINALLRWLPGTQEWANVGIPYTPQVGLMVGFMADLFADNVAYLIAKVAPTKLPWLAKPNEEKP